MIFLECPACKINLEIIELNCCIFRCGIIKKSFKQIDPHLSKIECEKLIKNDEIYGCGSPFQVIKNNEEYKTIICDYI